MQKLKNSPSIFLLISSNQTSTKHHQPTEIALPRAINHINGYKSRRRINQWLHDKILQTTRSPSGKEIGSGTIHPATAFSDINRPGERNVEHLADGDTDELVRGAVEREAQNVSEVLKVFEVLS